MEIKTSVIGCGLMGSAIARALHRKGRYVSAFNRSPAPLKALHERGIATTTEIDVAIERADILIVVLSSYSAIRSVLDRAKEGALKGKLMLNLTSGNPSDAAEMDRTAGDLGMGYLDGSIWALPSMIGCDETVITVAGSARLWREAEPVVAQLGGSSFYAGERIESGNVLEACFPGSFFMTAQNSFIESMRLARKSGIETDIIARSVVPSLKLLRAGLDDLIAKVDKHDDATLEATMDVYLHAAKSYQQTVRDTGMSAPLLNLLVEQFQDAVNQGQGHLGPSVMLRR